ncbi:trans-Golgi network integral membrane protein 1 [Polyergus mexicanus]|uniref:trans-Golgi network integral membrane protein 1 n=1 Tax=Polyergus mexicanus TaxID=615972 RepID=UPI0038B460D9
MENRYALFRVTLVLNILILVISFTRVMSVPAKPTITEVMKNDKNLCDTSKFLYESEYTKLCALLPYPNDFLSFTKNLNIFLCLGVYDTAYKICQYSSQLPPQIPHFNSTAILTTYIEKFAPNASPTQQKEFCDSLQGFTSLYNKTYSFLNLLVESLNKSYKCQKICFDLEDKFRPLCALFAWIKKFDDIKKAKRTETKHKTIESLITPSNETTSNSRSSSIAAKIENYETNTNNTINQNDNKVEKSNLNMSGIVPTVYAEPDVEKIKPDTEKSSKGEKKSNDASIGTQPHKVPVLVSVPFDENEKNTIDTKTDTNKIAKPMNTPANDDLQVSSINNPVDDVPKKDLNEEKAEEVNKEQNTDDLKTSTLSDNTQDHYDVGNPEEDIEPNVADSNNVEDDPVQQSTRNQNENVQEVVEQKNMQYSNIRTEDDSHFFTYFTVITVACIAGYIGYHNKQKILAIVLEGRRSRSNRGRRRPSTANYRKLDCTLEEAVTSQCNANVTHVIY